MSLIEGTLRYALASWNQLENRLKKKPLVARQLTEKFEDLLAQRTIEYEKPEGCETTIRTTQTLDEGNFLLHLQIVLSHYDLL